MPFRCSLEEQRKQRKQYRERHKARIALAALPKEKEKRLIAKALNICTKCFNVYILDSHSYCDDCLQKAKVATAKWRAK